MRWWTFLKAHARYAGKPRVTADRALENLRICLFDCDARQFNEVEERDFTEAAVHAACGVGGKVTVWCGEPGVPEMEGPPAKRKCGCWLGVEVGLEETSPRLTLKGRTIVASAATITVGKSCPRGYWSN